MTAVIAVVAAGTSPATAQQQQNDQTIMIQIQASEPAYEPPLCLNFRPGSAEWGRSWGEDANRADGCVKGQDGLWRAAGTEGLRNERRHKERAHLVRSDEQQISRVSFHAAWLKFCTMWVGDRPMTTAPGEPQRLWSD